MKRFVLFIVDETVREWFKKFAQGAMRVLAVLVFLSLVASLLVLLVWLPVSIYEHVF